MGAGAQGDQLPGTKEGSRAEMKSGATYRLRTVTRGNQTSRPWF